MKDCSGDANLGEGDLSNETPQYAFRGFYIDRDFGRPMQFITKQEEKLELENGKLDLKTEIGQLKEVNDERVEEIEDLKKENGSLRTKQN